VILAKRGARNLDEGEEKINDEGLASRLRKKAAGIRVRSLLAAAVLTISLLVFP
jgi:hypothetical protein